jgi:hypothetical protein
MKIIKLTLAVVVPLMIGIFTVVMALQESKSAQFQRDADIVRIERQAQLQQEAEARQ